MFKKRIIGILCIIMILIVFSACGSDKTSDNTSRGNSKTIIKIGYLPITHSLAVLETKDYLDETDGNVAVELQKFNTWPDLMDALNSGKIDGASVLMELAMAAKGKGVDLTAVALSHNDGNVIVVSKDIASAKDLKGKKIAIPSTQSTHYILLKEILEENGLKEDDVTILQLAPTEMPFSLASKSIDGYCVAEPFGAQIVAKDLGNILAKDCDIWEDSVCCSLVFNRKCMSNKQAATDEMISAYKKVSNRMDEDRKYDIAEKYLGQEKNVIEESLKLISFENLEITEESYEKLKDKMIKCKINENPPSYEEFVYQEKGMED